MHEELVIAGAGGQGIVLAGALVSLAAMEEGKETTHYKSYGAAMRGGKATCTVIVSSQEIGSPISGHPDSLIVVNKPSLKFVEMVKPGGLIVINKSLVDWDFSREDVEVLEIRASDIAQELKDPRIVNLVILGAYLKRKKTVTLKNLKKALQDLAVGKKWNKRLIALNKKALQRGWDLPC